MIKNYVEMVEDDVDKVIKTGEYDYIIKNCKTEDELRDRLYDALLTDIRVTGNATRYSSYYSDSQKAKKMVTNFGKEVTFAFGEMGLDLIDYLKAERYEDIDVSTRSYYLVEALENSIAVVDRWCELVE
jgi:hypothetical protein